MSYEVIEPDAIRVSDSARELVGEQFGATVSLIVVDTPPGRGPDLHTHPYEEVFVVHSGEADFTVGEEVVRAGPGQVVTSTPARRTGSRASAPRTRGWSTSTRRQDSSPSGSSEGPVPRSDTVPGTFT